MTWKHEIPLQHLQMQPPCLGCSPGDPFLSLFGILHLIPTLPPFPQLSAVRPVESPKRSILGGQPCQENLFKTSGDTPAWRVPVTSHHICLLACLHNIHLCTHDLFTKSRSNGCALHRPFSETDRKHLGPSPRFGSEPFKVSRRMGSTKQRKLNYYDPTLSAKGAKATLLTERGKLHLREESSEDRSEPLSPFRTGQQGFIRSFSSTLSHKTYTLKTSVLLIPVYVSPPPGFIVPPAGRKEGEEIHLCWEIPPERPVL